ncbi:MAG: hypothetical protein ACE5HR_00075 [bacterium]
MDNNKIKVKLEQIKNIDKDGKSIKDKEGNLIYIRHDAIALSQLINAVDSKVVATGEYPAWIALDDKSREALKQDRDEIELTVDEASFLKKLFSNPQNDRVTLGVFHVRTINGILEQLK